MPLLKRLSARLLEHRLTMKWEWRLLYSVLSITIPLLIYAAILIIGGSQAVGLAVRYDFTYGLVAFIFVLYLTYRLAGWTGTLVSCTLTLTLFALALSALWNSGVSDAYIIGGLLPWSDASGYYWDARRVLEGGTFSYFSSRRPLYIGMLSAVLGLTQQNLQIALAILVAITAICCFLLAREIQRNHGTAAGVLMLILQFLFYRWFLGKTSTETLGLSLGALSFALLWRGAGERRINLCLLGLFLLTLALNARAGAFFILPAIIIWGTWSFRGTAQFSWRFLLGGTSVMLLGFLLNLIVLKTVGSPDGVGFSNFSHTLYGLIVGGDWTQVTIDHPEVESLNEPELSQRIYALAFEALRANPLGLVHGSMRAWKLLLFNDYIFSFTHNPKVNFALQLLSLMGLVVCYQHRHEPKASLLIMATLGLLISVPFAPPWDHAEMRAFAATIPFVLVLPALGLERIANTLNEQQIIKDTGYINDSRFLFILGIILGIFVFVAPITTKVFSRTPKFADISCQAGKETVYLRFSSGSFVNLVADNSLRKTHLPNVRISDFRNNMETFSVQNPELAKELTRLSPSTTMINTFNLKNWQPIWLISSTSKLPKEKGIVGVCGNWATELTLPKYYGVFYAESIQKVLAN
jgi:hypothetical protein